MITYAHGHSWLSCIPRGCVLPDKRHSSFAFQCALMFSSSSRLEGSLCVACSFGILLAVQPRDPRCLIVALISTRCFHSCSESFSHNEGTTMVEYVSWSTPSASKARYLVSAMSYKARSRCAFSFAVNGLYVHQVIDVRSLDGRHFFHHVIICCCFIICWRKGKSSYRRPCWLNQKATHGQSRIFVNCALKGVPKLLPLTDVGPKLPSIEFRQSCPNGSSRRERPWDLMLLQFHGEATRWWMAVVHSANLWLAVSRWRTIATSPQTSVCWHRVPSRTYLPLSNRHPLPSM